MPIYRIQKDKANPYVMVNKAWVSDSSLSYRAKGVLLYLLSKPDDWQVRENDIINHATEGRHAIRQALKELKQAGYIRKDQSRDEHGRFQGAVWDVFEEPLSKSLISSVRLSDVGKSVHGGNPHKTRVPEFNDHQRELEKAKADGWTQ